MCFIIDFDNNEAMQKDSPFTSCTKRTLEKWSGSTGKNSQSKHSLCLMVTTAATDSSILHYAWVGPVIQTK
ncbi:hypothetical protein BH10BAC3_BH10BAC3_30860 [soil metagenome]